MRYQQNSRSKAPAVKRLILQAAAGIGLALLLPLAGTAQSAFAAGDASFSLGSSGSTKVGGTFTVVVNETSAGADNVDAVQADVSYPTSLLQYKSMSLGAFTLCGQQTAGGGQVDVGCASTSTVSGTQTVVTITFSVVGAGAAQVKLLSGSQIDDTTGSDSIWNGSLSSATYTLSAVSAPKPSGGGSTGHSGGGAISSGSTSKAATPAPSATTKPTPSKPATTTKTATPTIVSPPADIATLTLTVTDGIGKPVDGAKVSVGGRTAYTNARGVVSLSDIPSGTHTVKVSAPGKGSSETTLTLSTGQVKDVSMRLGAKPSSVMPVLYGVLGMLVLAGGVVAFLKMHGGHKGSIYPTPGVVVGSGGGAPVPPASVPAATPPVSPPPPQGAGAYVAPDATPPVPAAAPDADPGAVSAEQNPPAGNPRP